MEEKVKSIEEKLLVVTVVLGMNWIRAIFLWAGEVLRLSQESDFPITSYTLELIIGILWIGLLIHYIGGLGGGKIISKGKFRSLRDKLAIATLVCALQWIPSIPTILGEAYGEIFWEKYSYIIFFSYLMALAIIWVVFFIYYHIGKKKVERQEGKKENLQTIKNRAIAMAFVVVIQYIIWLLNMYGFLVFWGYLLILVIVWGAFLICYFIKK